MDDREGDRGMGGRRLMPLASMWFVRITFIGAATICFILTPFAVFMGGMATDSGSLFALIVGSLIIVLPPGLGFGFLIGRGWLEKNPRYLPFGVAVGCAVAGGLLGFVAAHPSFFPALVPNLPHLWAWLLKV